MSATRPITSGLKSAARPLARVLQRARLDPRLVLAQRRLKRKYDSELLRFQELGGRITHKWPIVTDWEDEAGSTRGHYFHQDLLVASYIHERNPVRHIDVGSRIDGFVAHLAAFRKIEVMDVRDLHDTGHRNISFIKADLMDRSTVQESIADSLSCLHAIEHFGLGRYGDPLDPNGHLKGFNNILRMLSPGGLLYISFPIGRANEVHFNAHRIFHPLDIMHWADAEHRIALRRFDCINDAGTLLRDIAPEAAPLNMSYGCGIYTFQKLV